jgi:cell division septum initiation protein DivIVA
MERQLAARDREIQELRDNQPPMSITEEIERIGEQTASILVVAHDQAHETTRRAQEQAERCIADAAANAVAITAEAKERLRELDDETDSVWRERDRLLEDTRSVSERLASLVDEAVSRFPADADKSPAPGTAAQF